MLLSPPFPGNIPLLTLDSMRSISSALAALAIISLILAFSSAYGRLQVSNTFATLKCNHILDRRL